MNANDTNADTCNSLLRGVLSAIETYNQVIAKYSPLAGDHLLEGIRADHIANAVALRKLVVESGGTPATSSGVWGTFATAAEGAATLLGESPALMVLEQGEQHGIREYEDALEDDDLSESVKDLIRETLLPSQRGHLMELARCKTMAV